MIRHLHRFVLSIAANINDRSMLGKRDSEIAAIIKDREFVSFISNFHVIIVHSADTEYQ